MPRVTPSTCRTRTRPPQVKRRSPHAVSRPRHRGRLRPLRSRGRTQFRFRAASPAKSPRCVNTPSVAVYRAERDTFDLSVPPRSRSRRRLHQQGMNPTPRHPPERRPVSLLRAFLRMCGAGVCHATPYVGDLNGNVYNSTCRRSPTRGGCTSRPPARVHVHVPRICEGSTAPRLPNGSGTAISPWSHQPGCIFGLLA